MIAKLPILLLAVLFAWIAPLRAADSKFDFETADQIAAVLTRQAGQVVELRLKSGEKIGGKVEKVGANLVHLAQLTGAEFFEAVVVIEDISAVVVRAAPAATK